MGKSMLEDATEPVSVAEKSSSPRSQIEIPLPDGYLSMLLAALFSAVIPWALIVTTCIAVYFSTANNAWMTDTKWTDALALGCSIWALAYGSPIPLGSGSEAFTISLVPLGISFLMVYIGAGMSRRLLGKHRESIFYFILNYVIVVGLLSMVTDLPNSRVQLLLGALVVSFCAGLFALRKDSVIQRRDVSLGRRGLKNRVQDRLHTGLERQKQKWQTLKLKFRHLDYAYRDDLRKRNIGVDRDEFVYDGPKYSWSIPGWMISGIRLGWYIFGVLMTGATLLLLLQIKLHWQDFMKLHQLTGASDFGAVILFLGQLLYLPVLLIWNISWILGVGFYQGTGFYRSVFADVSGPYPVIPVFTLMPNYQPGYVILWAVVLAAIAVSVIAYLSFARVDFFYHLATVLVATVTCLALVLFLSWLSFGAIGPQNMQKWGAPPLFMTAVLLLEVFIPFILVFILLHPQSRNLFRKCFTYSYQNTRQKAAESLAKKMRSNKAARQSDAKTQAPKTVEIETGVEAEIPVKDEAGTEDLDSNKVDTEVEKDCSGKGEFQSARVKSRTEEIRESRLNNRGRVGTQDLNSAEIRAITSRWAASSGEKMFSKFRGRAEQTDTEIIDLNTEDRR